MLCLSLLSKSLPASGRKKALSGGVVGECTSVEGFRVVCGWFTTGLVFTKSCQSGIQISPACFLEWTLFVKPHLKYIFPLWPTLLTVKWRPSLPPEFPIPSGMMSSVFDRFKDLCRKSSLLFFTRRNEFVRPFPVPFGIFPSFAGGRVLPLRVASLRAGFDANSRSSWTGTLSGSFSSN